MVKKAFIVFISCIAITGSVFAAHDCDVVGSGVSNAMSGYLKLSEYHNVMPVSGFNQALINLKAYCCSQVVQTCDEKEKANLPKFYPESAYLFDHLLDIMMRRLDGYTGVAYGLEPDATALARRNAITAIANKADGATAYDIEEVYKTYRTLHINTTKNIDTTIKNYKPSNPVTLSLLDKYSTLCQVTKNMYEAYKTYNTVIVGSYGEKKSFFNGCENMVYERVKRENSYVKLLMVQKSNKLLDEVTKAYTKKYFVEEKIMGLWTLVSKVKDMFQTIVQQAAVSKSCSL